MSRHGYRPVPSTIPAPGAQSGFSLIELMISLVIGLVILGALVAMFSSTSRANREMATANSVIENGRFALQLLENDVVHGGFWGSYVPQYDDQTSAAPPTDVPTIVPDPCRAYRAPDPSNPNSWNAAYVTALLAIPVQVYGDDQLADGTSCEDVVTAAHENSDVLVVRHADTRIPDPTGIKCEADRAGCLYFQSSLCTLLCESPPTKEVARFVLDQTRSDPAADAAVFSLRQRDGVTRAVKRRFVSNIYYVSDLPSKDERNEDVTIPTLMRSSFVFDPDSPLLPPDHVAAVPLVEGVEAIRVELGIDNVSQTNATLTAADYGTPVAWQDPDTKEIATNRGDGIPDGLFRLCSEVPCYNSGDAALDALQAFTLMNVTAVRIHVLARSRERTPGYKDTKTYRLGQSATVYGPCQDGFKCHVYTTTVRLPNISGRRLRP